MVLQTIAISHSQEGICANWLCIFVQRLVMDSVQTSNNVLSWESLM